MKLKASITGINGFIGKALKNALLKADWEVYEYVRKDVDYLFLFGSPSSNNWYNHALSYSVRETVENFLNALDFCREHKIKLIYPSSGTVYDGKTAYAETKRILESLASIYGGDVLGLRIFAGYGVGEGHKGKYASVVYQFIRDMKQMRCPEIWGGGKQTRDFVYIDDIVRQIIKNREKTGTIDIGTGINTSFQDLIKMINRELKTDIKPRYASIPDNYVQQTVCKNPCDFEVPLVEGIRRMIKEEQYE